MSDGGGPWGRPEPQPPPRSRPYGAGRRNRLLLGVGIALCAGLCILGLAKLDPSRTLAGEDWSRAIYSLGFLALVCTSLLSRRLRWGQTIRYGLLWAAVIAVLLVGYSFRDEFGVVVQHVRSELAPSSAVETGPHEMAVTAEDDGNFYIRGTVNGAPVRFLVDTGASEIVLSPADARRLGVDTAALDYRGVYETANGIGHGAPFRADSLSVGPVTLANVAMSINQAPMSTSLLGLAFLKRFESFEIKGRRLFLRWRS